MFNNNIDIIDLTHTLNPDIPSWNGGCGFNHEIKLDYDSCKTDVKFRVQQLKMHCGIGTHMDAPSHCVPGGASIADLALENLITSCIVIDVSKQADENFSVQVNDIEIFEKQYGEIPANSLVIFYTGWEKHWDNAEKYRNNYKFPSISGRTAEHLLKKNIAGIGIDTLSPDRPIDGFPVHKAILGAGKYIIENVANSSQLPPQGSFSLALPIPIELGTEAPVRLVSLVPT